MYAESTKGRSFKDMKKMFKSSIRNRERGDTEICHITLKLIFRCELRNRSGSLV